jgi:lysozyme
MEKPGDPMLDILLPMLRVEEGTKLQVYDDANSRLIKPGVRVIGHPTIGTGRCLDTNGITDAEADYLLSNDIAKVSAQLDAALPWWRDQTPARQAVLASMVFQMGLKGTLGFTQTLAAVRAGAYAAAATRMLASTWAKQTPARVGRLAAMMRKG